MTEVRLGPDNASFTEKVDNEYTKNIYRYVTEIDKSLSKDLSEIDFERAVQDEAYATEMYGFISSHDNTFKEDVSLEQFLSSVKKKELEQPTESVSEDGLSESQLATRPIESERLLGGISDRRFEVQQEVEQRKLSGIPEDEPVDLPENFVVADEFYTPEQRALRQQRIDEFDLQGDAEEFRRYQELMDAQGEVEIPELTTVLQNTNVSQASVDALRMAYGQYGFRFEGDVADGNGTIVAYNNYFGDAAAIELKVHNGEVLGIEQLNVFLSNNKAPVNAVTPQERSEAERALRIQEMRRGSRKQLDGRVDTHNLSFVEQNGKYLVFPTLFPKDPTSTLSNPSAWLDLNEEQALDEAKRRDEVLFVNTEEEAKALVDGSWQDFDTMDLEGERLYREYGRDYYAERQAGRDLQDMMDEYKAIETLEYGTRVEDNELVRKYPQYFIDGNMVRDDMGDKKKELELSIDILSEQMDEEELERLNEDFDSILDTRLSERAARAASIGRDARILMDDAKVRAQTQFNLNIEDLVGSEAADPREFQEKLNIVETYAAGAKERFQAAQMYEQAELYFDKKLNKQITGILVDGAVNSWVNEWDRSVARGEAGTLLTSMHFGLGPDATREDVVRAAGQMLDHENKNTGRSKARVNDAATWGQTKDAFFESPLDYTSAVLAESIGMLMPQVLNWRTGGMIVAGAGVGALTGGPGGALAGAVEGLGYAATGAFAIAEYGLEMGQAFIDVAMEEGYDLKDPMQAMRAAQDLEMWERAEKRGHQRGVPIAIASALSNLAAGRILTASKYLPGKVRYPAMVAGVMTERVTIDPLFEMAGEYGALVSSGQFTGSTANWKEIYAEGLGAMGQGAPMAVVNTASKLIFENRFKMAVDLMDIDKLSEERANLGLIQRWTNNMEKLEKISPEMAEYIRRNVGLLREANVLLGRKPNSRGRLADPEVTARLVRLLEAKKIIEGDGRSSQQNQSGAFSELLSRINDEIAETVRTGRLSEEGVELNPSQREFTPGMEPDLSQEEELELLVAKARPGVYQIDGSFMDRVKFVNTIKEEKDIRKLKKAVVLNDPLVASLLKIQQNAIQKRKATPLPVGEQAQSSEEVDEEVRVDPPTQEELDDYKEGSLTSERISLIEGDIVEILSSKGELDAIQQQFYEFNAEEIDRRVTEFNAFVEDNVITEDGKPVTKENLGIIAKAKNAVAALAKNFPEVKVVLHDTRESYEKASKDTTGSGTYLWDQKEIHIDLTTANDRTVAHETFHAVLRNSIDESDVRALMDDFVETLLKVLPEDSDILSRLNEFMQRYEEGVRSEEFVAEFFGMVADAYPELDVKEKGVVARFLERLASMLNIELNLSTDLNKRDKQILSLLETLSGKVAKGETITTTQKGQIQSLVESKDGATPDGPRSSQQLALDNLRASQQRAFELTDSDIEALAFEGILAHFTVANIREFEPGRGRVQYYGEGIYFTGTRSYASMFPFLTTKEMVSFVDVSKMNLLTVHNSYNVSAELENQIVDMVMEMGPVYNYKGDLSNRQQVFEMLFDPERPGLTPLFRVHSQIVRQGLYNELAKIPAPKNAEANAGQYVRPLFEKFFPEYQGIVNKEGVKDGLPVDVVVWDYDAINKNIVFAPLNRLKNIRDLTTSEEKPARPRWGGRSSQQVTVESNEDGSLTFRTEGGKLDAFPDGNVVTLDNIFVEPDVQRQGVATQLVDAAMDEFRDQESLSVIDEDGNTIEEPQPFIISIGTRVTAEGDAFYDAVINSIEAFNRRNDSKPEFNEDGLSEVRMSRQMGMEEATAEWVEENFKNADEGLREFLVEFVKQPGVRLFLNPIGGGFFYANQDKGSTELDVRTSIYMERGFVYLDLLEVIAGDKSQGAGTRFMQDFVAALDASNQSAELLAWPPKWYQQGMSDEEMEAISKRLQSFYSRFGFTPKSKFNDNSMTREPGAVPKERTALEERTARERANVLTSIADTRTKKNVLGHIIAETYDVYSEQYEDKTEFARIDRAVDPYDEGVLATDLYSGRVTAEQIEEINDEYGDGLINEDGFAENFEDFVDSDIVDDYVDLVIEEKEISGRLRNVERRVKEEDEAAGRRERRLGKLEDNTMALEHILAVNEDVYGRTETDVYNQYEAYLEGRLDEADKEYLRSLELGIDVETGEVDNASNLYDVFQELQDVREQRNDLERRSSQQRTMETDGTGLDVQGTEEVVTGEVSPTVLDKKNQELTDDYRLEDAVGTIKSVASRAVSAARKAAAGKVSYNKRNPRTGKVKVITVEYPYQNKKLLSLLNRRTNAAKKATGKKRAALMERVKETTSQILDEFVDTMTENILAVYDTLTPEFIEASKEWYVGANRVANELARKYNISPEQAGAVLAVLSPQNDWFNNISVAERVMEVMSKHSNTPFSREIFEKALDKNKTGAWSSFLKDAFARYEGMTLDQINEQGVSLATQTVILRAIDQGLYPGKVLLTDPDGRFLGFDTTPVRWGATSEIAKAISAFRNPDIDSIRMNLGYGNKVRNFYNNIVDPNSSYPYVTADTHAVAVAMSAPMSADDAGGVGLFDGGFSPMYMLVKEAYINAAEIAGIRPREMQSITWEAVRVGMNNANRTAAAVEKNKSKLKSLVENENVSPYEAARRILINNPSVNPEWATARGIQVQIPDLREGVRESADSRGRDILSLRGRSGRDVGDTGTGVGVQPTEDRSSQQRLAPNGKPSNLTPEQYDLVRTEAFKNWFGDWENDPKNASKIVDDNGEPMVVYHGSVDPDIQEFSEEGAYERRRSGLNEEGVFFSSNRDLAQDYATLRAKMSKRADEQMKERGYKTEAKRQGGYVPTVYAAFLDMKNPYRFDGKGMYYPDYYDNVPYLEITTRYGKSGKRAVTAYLGNNTMYDTPYDGVVAENVIDYHSFSEQPSFDPVGDTIIVPFSSKPAIKLADGSNATFSTDDSRISRQIPPSRQVEKNVEEAFREGTPFEASDFEVESSQQKLERLAQPDDSMQDIIDRGRERYMPDSVIVAVLIKKYGRKNMKAISNAMAINYDINRAMPQVFGDVKGGLKAGREIYIDVMKALDEFASPKKEKLKPLRGKVRNDRIAELRKEFPKEEEKSDKQLLKDHPRKVKLIAPTKAEVVAKAMELLTENPEFKKQTPDLQDKMVVGFNRAMSTRANKGIQNKLRELRNNISMRKQGAKAAAEVKSQMRALMEEALPKAVYSKGEVKRMLGIIDRVNEKNYQVEAEKLISVIESKRQEMSNNVLKDIQRFVRKAARTYKTSSGRVRTRGLDAVGQAYFQEAERVMLAIKNNDVETLGRMAEEHANNALVNELINARNEGAKLTVKEQSLLDRVSAYDMFIRLLDMNLEEREAVLEDLRINEGFSRFALTQQRLINARRAEALRQGAAEDVRSNYGAVVLGPDGLPMNDNEIGAKRSVILARWKDSSAREKYDMLKDLMKTMSQESAGKLAKGLRQGIHLGTYSSILGDYFYENIFSSVNRMEEEYNRGVIDLSAKMDELANSIDGIEDGYAEIAELAMSNTKMFTLNMKGRQQAFFMDSLMRLYALSLNPLQRQRLVEMGIDMSELDAIIDPKLREFVEKTVDFLSNEYYEGINDVYRSVNSVNLPHIENYFPTQTLVPTKVSINELKEGLLGMPSAQTASALKLRTATTGEVALGSEAGGLSFFQVLEQHNKSMERFKAFAEGTRDINSILSTQELRSLLTVFNGNQMLNLLVNNSVNPEQFVSEMSYPLADWMTKKFTFAALAFKVFQAFKQYASIPMAFEGYKYRPDSSRFTDALMFSFDVARLTVHMLAELATLGKYKGPVAEAMDISATFQQRVKQGFSGDIYTLEQGSVGIRNPRDKFKKGQRFVKGMERAGGMTTAIGDIGGVMGYFVNYRRNIENGMSKEEALEKFNDFNVTQQSRRPSERVPVQIYQNGILRLFTAFGSTYFLYANNTVQAGNKILRAIRKGEKPSSKDVRRFYLNAIYGHVIWTMAANASLLIKGDKEDRKKALKRMLVSPLGPLTLIPIVGAQVKGVMNALAGDDFKASVGLDPLEGLIREVKKSFKEERYGRAVSEIFEYGLGVNFDMFRGLYKIAEGEEVTEGTYEALGIPKTTRPESDE